MARPGMRAEQKVATRVRLIDVARDLFAEHGYDETTVAMVCRHAQVTHGALYHHFPGKLELFEAVLHDVGRRVAIRISEPADAAGGWPGLEAAFDRYLDVCADPVVNTILLRDGPRVARAHFEQNRDANEALLVGLLRTAVDEGALRPVAVDLTARVLGAAFAAAGASVAASADRDEARREARDLLWNLLGALRANRP